MPSLGQKRSQPYSNSSTPVGTVVLPDSAPLTFAEIGPPFLPGNLLLPILFETTMLYGRIQHWNPLEGTDTRAGVVIFKIHR